MSKLQITPNTVVMNVNRQNIGRNKKKVDEAALAAQPAPDINSLDGVLRLARGRYGAPLYGQRMEILDAQGNVAATMEYDPHDSILPCGARVVLICHHGARRTCDGEGLYPEPSA